MFGTFEAWKWLPFEQADHRLSEIVQSYWTNFAKTGNPNGAELPGWREFEDGRQSSLEFGKSGQVRLRDRSAPPFCIVNAKSFAARLGEHKGF